MKKIICVAGYTIYVLVLCIVTAPVGAFIYALNEGKRKWRYWE